MEFNEQHLIGLSVVVGAAIGGVIFLVRIMREELDRPQGHDMPVQDEQTDPPETQPKKAA